MIMTVIAIIISAVLALLVVFQLSLVCGLPLGRFAWGGQHKILPTKLRIGSIVSVLIYGVLAIFALSKADIVAIIANQTVLTVGLWLITVYLAFGILLNAISRSKPERYLMTPVALVLFIGFLLLVLA